jgi:8-oxo-dGTP pyrophosphatase MutT (NUDIX family)
VPRRNCARGTASQCTGKATGAKDRVALGIACCRYVGGRPELLLISPRCTYAYRTFARSKYDSSDSTEMIRLFSKMTVDEKLDILSLNFVQIWYRMWLSMSFKNASFFVAKNKFESAFVADGGTRLRRLISCSTNADKSWEIPKGRKNNKLEANIECAVREFREETSICKKKYKLFPAATKTYSYIDEGVRYTNIYYFAFMHHAANIQVNVTSSMISEISDIRWMSIEDIRAADKSGRLEGIARSVFSFMKKNTRITT